MRSTFPRPALDTSPGLGLFARELMILPGHTTFVSLPGISAVSSISIVSAVARTPRGS